MHTTSGNKSSYTLPEIIINESGLVLLTPNKMAGSISRFAWLFDLIVGCQSNVRNRDKK